MKELVIDNWGHPSLRVYPYLSDDAPDIATASSGCVEAIYYYTDNTRRVWGVRVNMTFPFPVRRAETDALKTAIDRCWQWIDEQEAKD